MKNQINAFWNATLCSGRQCTSSTTVLYMYPALLQSSGVLEVFLENLMSSAESHCSPTSKWKCIINAWIKHHNTDLCGSFMLTFIMLKIDFPFFSG